MERVQEHNTLVVYQSLPTGCIPFLVKDDYSTPFIRSGEWVVVDTTDRTARVGDIYVVQWTSGGRNLCQARHSSKAWQTEGREPRWQVGSMRTSGREDFERWLQENASNRQSGGIPTWRGAWTDGPFRLDHLESIIVGAVVGLYQTEFSEPLRTIGEEGL